MANSTLVVASTVPNVKESRTTITPNNAQQITQQCEQEFYNSGFGKAVNFFSLGSLIPGWGPNPMKSLKEWGLAIVVKGGGGTAAVAALNKYDTQTITSISEEAVVGSSAGSGLNTLLHFAAEVGTGLTVAATGVDVLMHAGCGNSALNATGQANIPVNPGMF